MTWVLIGLLVYLWLTFVWRVYVAATRPSCCRKGHTDFYLNPNGWRCRQCAVKAERTRLRRIYKEMNETQRRNRRRMG